MARYKERTLTYRRNHTARRIGLLGGSFNPAHGGHRRISQFTLDALGLDEVWWMVSPGNPLKPKEGMAPLSARYRSALGQSKNARIVPTVIEQELGTLYTANTLRSIQNRYPKKQFIWLMGSDNLAQFHLWRDWRSIARRMPIAVIARPSYNAAAMTSPAMAWLRRYRVSVPSFKMFLKPGKWSAPALVYLQFDPDTRSATALRRNDPDWAASNTITPLRAPIRDRVTHQLITQMEDV